MDKEKNNSEIGKGITRRDLLFKIGLGLTGIGLGAIASGIHLDSESPTISPEEATRASRIRHQAMLEALYGNGENNRYK